MIPRRRPVLQLAQRKMNDNVLRLVRRQVNALKPCQGVIGKLRTRRWVIYAGAPDPSVIGPEWHAWLHRLTDAPLPDTGARPWQKPHIPNLTGTPASYRPAGHDYMGGTRAKSSADYEAWAPDKA